MELYENKNGMYWNIEPEEIVIRYIEENKKYKEVLNRLKVVYTSMQFSAPENMYVFIEQMGELLEGVNESI